MFHQMDFIVFLSCLVLLNVQSSHGSEIIGGKVVTPHSWPFIALLESDSYCGGTLIDPSWVLTAAHCKNMRRVLLGVHSIKAAEQNFRQVLNVLKSYPHPSFNAVTSENDLMLLKLEKSAKETNTVQVRKVGNTIKDPEAGTLCTVAGWGRTDYTVQQRSDVLMSVDVTVIARETCKNIKKNVYSKRAINSDMICAGPAGKKEAGICNGDSGGPLLCGGEQVGVVSYGPVECGQIADPGVYSYLSGKQLKWIQDTMKNSDA